MKKVKARKGKAAALQARKTKAMAKKELKKCREAVALKVDAAKKALLKKQKE